MNTTTSNNPHQSTPSLCILLVVATTAFMSIAQETKASSLEAIYIEIMAQDPLFEQMDYQNRAAMENVATQKRLYLPSITATAQAAMVNQTIRDSGNSAFPEGAANFNSTRFKVEFDQPLFDPTIRPRIRASQAKLLQTQSHGELHSELKTRVIIREFLQFARFNELIGSTDRVITRLSREAESVTKSREANVATVNDVQSVKLSLAGVRRERNNFLQQKNAALAVLGVSPESVTSIILKRDAFHSPMLRSVEVYKTAGIRALQAEADAYTHQAAAAKRRSFPVVTLYGQYGNFLDGGSAFGGEIDKNVYEIGVMIRWDIFNWGMNRSESRELDYLKLAKEAELRSKQKEIERANTIGLELLEQSRESVNEIVDIVKQHGILKDSASRSYEAGTGTYLNSINAMLAHEAAIRDSINAHHDLLQRQLADKGGSQGWNPALVSQVSNLFAIP